MGNKGRGEKTKMNKGRREGQGERANNNKEFSYVFVWCLFRSLIGPKSGQNPKKKKHPNLQPHFLSGKKNNKMPRLSILLLALVFATAVYCDEHDHSECVCIAEDHGWKVDCSNQAVMQAAFNLLQQYNCGTNCASDVCQDNFYIVQAHHDRCLEDDVPEEIEKDFHDYEDACIDCEIARQYDPTLPACPPADCSDDSDAITAYNTLVADNCQNDCTSTDCVNSYRIVRSFHDNCEEDDIPESIERGIHDFEESCSAANCNAQSADDNDLSTSDCPAHEDDDHDDEFEHHQECVCIADERGWKIDCSNQVVMQSAFNLLQQYNCDKDCKSDICQDNFYIVQTHHDRCLEDDVPEEIEKDFHDYEDSCVDCEIARQYDPTIPECPATFCSEDGPAVRAYNSLIENNCNTDCSSDTCVNSYRIVRGFHDRCEEDDIPEVIERGIHDYEDSCEAANCNAFSADDDDLSTANCRVVENDDDDDNILPDDDESAASKVVPILMPLVAFVAVLFQ